MQAASRSAMGHERRFSRYPHGPPVYLRLLAAQRTDVEAMKGHGGPCGSGLRHRLG
jgi:hypothetical protein